MRAYERYLQDHESSEFADSARTGISLLKAQAAWERLDSAASLSELQGFIDLFGDSPWADDAWRRVDSIRVARAWANS